MTSEQDTKAPDHFRDKAQTTYRDAKIAMAVALAVEDGALEGDAGAAFIDEHTSPRPSDPVDLVHDDDYPGDEYFDQADAELLGE